MVKIRHEHSGNRGLARGRRLTTGVLLTALAVAGLPTTAVADTGQVPDYVATIGGPGHAQIYSSGLETTSDGGVVVADTGNDRVAKFDAAGSQVWTWGGHGSGTTGLSNPRDIGIDAAGNVFIADTGNSRVVKLSPTGTFVTFFNGPSGDKIASPIGITVANGEVIVSDAGADLIRLFDLNGQQQRTIGETTCPFSRPRDVTADSAGNYYVANYTADNILKLANDGSCLASWGTHGSGPGQFLNPYGIAVGDDPVLGTTLYVADSNNERIQMFTTSGDFVAELGAPGGFGTPGTFDSLRRVAVASDGDVWGADLWGNTIQRWDRTVAGWDHAQIIGSTQAPTTTTSVFNSVGGLAFDAAGDLYATDTVNQRIAHFSTTGALVSTCGARGFTAGSFNWPRAVAVDHVTGDMWVADTRQSRIQVLANDCSAGTVLGSVGTGAGNFSWPSGITMDQAARRAYLTDALNDRISVWDVATQAPLGTYGSSGAALGKFDDPRGIARNPVTGDLFVADRKNDRIVKLTDSGGSLTAVASFTGGFSRPEGVAVDGTGRIFVADTRNNRVVVLDANGAELGTFDGPDGLNQPTAAAIGPDGAIYVSDTYQDRVQKYLYPAAPDSAPPSVTVDQPTRDSVNTLPVTISGTGADDVGVTVVEYAVRDRATNKWWKPATQSWGGIQWLPAAVIVPGGQSVTWSASFDPGATGGSGLYFVKARARDAAGHTSSQPNTRFEANGVPLDTAPPDTFIAAPGEGDIVIGRPAVISGTAVDDANVTSVRVAIQDRTTKLWWRPATNSWGGFKRTNAVLGAPGGAQPSWTFSFDDTASPGSGLYLVQADSVDGAGNIDRSRANIRFSLVNTAPDTQDPDTAIATPTTGQAFPLQSVSLTGLATDNVGVTEVQIAIQDRISGLWWDGVAGTWGDYSLADATVDTPGGTSTNWSASFDGPAALAGGGSGDYLVQARALDATGNVDQDKPFSIFTIAPTPDTEEPDATILAPERSSSHPAGVVTVSGIATDDYGVASVDVAIRDRANNLWWNPTNQTWGTLRRIPATLTSPGAPSTAWSYDVDSDVIGGSGDYWVQARAVDNTGNADSSVATTYFLVNVSGAVPPQYLGNLAGPGTADITPVDVASTPTSYYVLDVGRYRIVRVNRTTGLIDASVGGIKSSDLDKLAAARAIALDSAGNLWVADTPNNKIKKFDADLNFIGAYGSKGAGLGQFTQVYGLAIGTGRLGDGSFGEVVYSIDGDGRIQRWNPDGTPIAQFAAGVALNQPRMAEVHPVTHDVWVVNARDREIVVINPDGILQFRFGRGGTAPGRFMGDPRGIAINPAGDRIFVSDEGNHRVQVFDAAGVYVGQLGGTSPDPSYLVDARGLEVTSDNVVVVTDEWDFALKTYQPTGPFIAKLFGAPAPVGGVNSPRGLAVDSLGHIFVSDWWNNRIQRFDADGTNALAFGFRGTTAEPGSINFAWGVAVQPGTDRLFVANRESHEIEVFEADGTYVTRWGIRGPLAGEFVFPHGVAFAPDGTLVVADSDNGRIQRFSINTGGDGTFVESYGTLGSATGDFAVPTGIDVAPDGTIWVADTENDRIQKRDPVTGTWTAFANPIGGSGFKRPWGVRVAPNGAIWVTDSGNDRIVRMDSSGNQEMTATGQDMGAGPLAQPHDLVFGSNGHLYVSDIWNNRVIELAP